MVVLFFVSLTADAMPYCQLSETESTYVFETPCHTFKIDEAGTLTTACIRETHEYCVAGTVCNITVISPSGREIAGGENMTWHPSYYQYTFPAGTLNEKGTYKATMFCQEGSPAKRGMAIFCFDVTSSGKGAGDDGSPSVGILIFLILINIGLFIISRADLSMNELLNHVLKGASLILGLGMLSLNMTVAVTLADVFGLGITEILFRYLWLFNWAIFLAMFILLFKYLIGGLKMWHTKKRNRRMGMV